MSYRDVVIQRKHKRPIYIVDEHGVSVSAKVLNTDQPLQITFWEIRSCIEESRFLAKMALDNPDSGVSRTRKVRSAIRMFEGLEKMLKIPLGIIKDCVWRYNDKYKTHNLVTLYDGIIHSEEHGVISKLDRVFLETVMVGGRPQFCHYTLPIVLNSNDNGIVVRVERGLSTYQIYDLREYLEMFNTTELYYQSYSGDAVTQFSEAYLAYPVDSEYFLRFIEKSLEMIINPWCMVKGLKVEF